MIATLMGLAIAMLCVSPALALPYNMLDWQEFPSKETITGGSWEQELFPDLTAGVVTFTEFGEEKIRGGQSVGILTIICSEQTYLSLIHYSPAGTSYIANPGLLVPENSQVSASFLMNNSQPEGLTLLLVWDKDPDQGWLNMLARHPNRTVEPVPGVISEGWFHRSPGGLSRHPWEDSFDNAYRQAPVGFSSGFPKISAGIDSFGTWRLKDCSAQTTGYTQQMYGMWGYSNVLELSSVDHLSIRYYQEGESSPNTAWFYLLAYAVQDSGSATGAIIDVEVNNWSITGTLPKANNSEQMQPLGFDVSHFLQRGYNLIEIRLAPGSGNSILLDNIELWVE